MRCAGLPSERTSRCGTWPPRSWPERRGRHLLNRTRASNGNSAHATPESRQPGPGPRSWNSRPGNIGQSGRLSGPRCAPGQRDAGRVRPGARVLAQKGPPGHRPGPSARRSGGISRRVEEREPTGISPGWFVNRTAKIALSGRTIQTQSGDWPRRVIICRDGAPDMSFRSPHEWTTHQQCISAGPPRLAADFDHEVAGTANLAAGAGRPRSSTGRRSTRGPFGRNRWPGPGLGDDDWPSLTPFLRCRRRIRWFPGARRAA